MHLHATHGRRARAWSVEGRERRVRESGERERGEAGQWSVTPGFLVTLTGQARTATLRHTQTSEADVQYKQYIPSPHVLGSPHPSDLGL